MAETLVTDMVEGMTIEVHHTPATGLIVAGFGDATLVGKLPGRTGWYEDLTRGPEQVRLEWQERGDLSFERYIAWRFAELFTGSRVNPRREEWT